MRLNVHILASASAVHRLHAAQTFIESHPVDQEILIVSAFREAADDLARAVALRRGATFGLHRFSLVELAAWLAPIQMAPEGTAPATRLGDIAIAARVAFQAAADGALHYYSPVIRFPGFPGALAATLQELRLAGAAPYAAAGIARGDLTELLHRFQDQLASGRLRDTADLLLGAAQAAQTNPAPSLVALPLVLLDTAITSPAHESFVAALAARAPSILVTVPAGDEETRRALLRIAPQASFDALPASPDDELDHVRRYLFSRDVPLRDIRTGNVVVFSAPGEGRESVEIARLVMDEARTHGVPFDQMAVLLRKPDAYSALLETALARAGIPAYFAQTTRRPDPAGRAFLTLLDCALEGFSARRFAEYLAFGQVPAEAPAAGLSAGSWTPPEDESFGPAAVAEPVPRDETATVEAEERETAALRDHGASADGDPAVFDGGLRAPWKWEELLVDAAVIGGLDRWRRRLAGLAAELELKLREVKRDSPDAPRVGAIERDLRNLEHLSTFALPVIERLAALPQRATWGEWIPALEALAPFVLSKPKRVLAALADLRPLGPVGPVALDEVRIVLTPHLAALERPRPASRYGRLFVGTIEQGRGRAFDVVFVPGLAERIFPQKPREDPILLDEDRRRLTSALRTQDDRSDHERFLLRLAVGAARKRVYLSYPRVDVDAGRARVASFYALEISRALTGTIPDPETLQRQAEAAVGITRLAWPSPLIPSQAIDETEHDLATLHTLLTGPRAAAKGRARYLLDLNDCLARSLRSRWLRWHAAWTPADGLAGPTEGTRPALEAARLRTRGYAVGALERFGVCPYQFFLSAILRLEPREETAPLETLDPLTRGAIAHEVQARLMRRLLAAGHLPLTPGRAPSAVSALEETLDEVSAEYAEQLAPAIPRVWQTEIDALRVDLRMWLDHVMADHAAWDPFAFELAFGLEEPPADVDPRSVRDEVTIDGGFRLRGIIDLIERRRDGTALRVTDHKTGFARAPRNLVVGGGAFLQPVLYGLAAQQLFGEPVAESRLSYCTRAGNFEERPVRIAGTQAVDRAREVLETIDQAIESGFLIPAPLPRACRHCSFLDVCGPDEERRIRHKEDERLRLRQDDRLARLRAMRAMA